MDNKILSGPMAVYDKNMREDGKELMRNTEPVLLGFIKKSWSYSDIFWMMQGGLGTSLTRNTSRKLLQTHATAPRPMYVCLSNSDGS